MNEAEEKLMSNGIEGAFVVYGAGQNKDNFGCGVAKVCATYNLTKTDYRDLRCKRHKRGAAGKFSKTRKTLLSDECLILIGADLSPDEVISSLKNVIAGIRKMGRLSTGMDDRYDHYETFEGKAIRL